jgi:hypothetical protein
MDVNKEYSSLYAALDKLSVTEKDDYLMEREGQVCVERGEELFFRNGKISPTSLEGYFECPFRHFAERGLKLKEREEATVLAVDSGNFIHLLLEKTTKKAGEIASEEEMTAYAKEVGAELLKSSVYAMQQDTGSGAYFAEKLLELAENPLAPHFLLSCLRFGDSAVIASLPSEPFVEIGLTVRRSIFNDKLCLISSHGNFNGGEGYGGGYIPNSWNYGRGGYESTPRSSGYSIHTADILLEAWCELAEK